MAWKSSDGDDQSAMVDGRLRAAEYRWFHGGWSGPTRASPAPRPLFLPCEQHGQSDRLWSTVPLRSYDFFVPGRGLRGRYRQHPHGKAPPYEMVTQGGPPRGRCPRCRSRRSA